MIDYNLRRLVLGLLRKWNIDLYSMLGLAILIYVMIWLY